MTDSPEGRSPLALALEWSTTIMTLAAQAVVPGLVGYGLDQWLGTGVWCLLIGFAMGGGIAFWELLRLVRAQPGRPALESRRAKNGSHGNAIK